MDRTGAGASGGLLCPGCATDLKTCAGKPAAGTARCPRCGSLVQTMHAARGEPVEGRDVSGAAPRSPPLGAATGLAQLGVAIDRAPLLGCHVHRQRGLAGLRRADPRCAWVVAQRIDDWSGVVAILGGVWFQVETQNPDSDLGPVLARVDAPQLFATIDSVGRRLGVKPPSQVRLTYLPCCGVVAWGRSRALIIGLPLFRVLTQGELRAIVAHELAHLARGTRPSRPGRPGSSRRWGRPWSTTGRNSAARSAPGRGFACGSRRD